MNTPVTVVGQLTSARSDFMCSEASGFMTWGKVRYGTEHPRPLPLLLEHCEDHRIGEVIFLQRSKRSGIHAVGVLDPDVDLRRDIVWSMSGGLTGIARRLHSGPMFEVREYDHATLFEVSLTQHAPADTVNPVVLVRGIDIRQQKGGYPASCPSIYRRALDAAHECACAQRRLPVAPRSTLTIVDVAMPPKQRSEPVPVPADLVGTGKVHRRINVGRITAVG